MFSLRESACLAAFACFILLDSSASESACHRGPSEGDEGNHIRSKTLRATIVFEGEAGRRSTLPDHLNIVEFKVHQVLKGDWVKRSQYVDVGYFVEQDFDSNNLSLKSRYLVFVDRPSNPDARLDNTRNYSTSGNNTSRFYHVSSFPEEFSNKAMKEVRNHACPKCALPPKILKEPKSRLETEGQKLRLLCRASGRPSPCITWYKDGVEIKSKRRVTIKEHRRDSRLLIRNVSALDSGNYRCQATSLVGTSSSRDIKVIVRNATLKPHSNLCRVQNFCLNGGTCYELSRLKHQYCEDLA